MSRRRSIANTRLEGSEDDYLIKGFNFYIRFIQLMTLHLRTTQLALNPHQSHNHNSIQKEKQLKKGNCYSPAQIPSRSSYPSAHFSHISGPSPSQPTQDLSHSRHEYDPSLFTQNLFVPGHVSVSIHSLMSKHPSFSFMNQPVLHLWQFFVPGPEQVSVQLTWHCEQSNFVSSLNAS